jgi:hypothetical protein
MKKYLSDNNVTNVVIYYNNNIIGFIHSRPLKILYDKKEKQLNYVEYLCVSENMRGCNIASILISSLIKRMNDIEYDIGRIYLFKKDGKEHSFLPFISSKYLCLELKPFKNNSKVHINTDCSLNYHEWKDTGNMYRLSRSMDENEWIDEMLIKNKYMISINDKSYMIIGQSSKLKHDNNKNVFDIEYIYNTKYNNCGNDLNLLIEYLANNGYDYITINDIGNYKNIIPNISEWKDGNSFQYYLYNGECSLIKNKDIYFTF